METENIHVLLEDQQVFDAVCKFLGTEPSYYTSPEQLRSDFRLKEITMALDYVVNEVE